jgi:hypothetical protein
MVRDVVVPVRAGGRNEELRYMLRTLKNLPDVGKVWIVGSKPDWLTNVNFIPSRPGKSKWHNIVDAIRVVCDERALTQEFIYTNDDHMVLQPVDELRPMHRGSTYQVPGYARMGGDWNRGHRDTARLLRKLGCKANPPLYYELHVPMVFDKALMAGVLDLAAPHKVRCLQYRSLYGNYYDIGGDYAEDCKPGVSLSAKKMFGTSTYLSTSDNMFSARRSAVVDYLKEHYPEPSQYES